MKEEDHPFFYKEDKLNIRLKLPYRFRTRYFIKCFAIILSIAFWFLFHGCSDPPENHQGAAKEKQTALSTVDQIKKKVLVVHSYHSGYEWTDGINKGILDTFGAGIDENGQVDTSKSTVILQIVYMDTKRKNTDPAMKKSALEIKQLIDSWKPDAVITSDDNAVRHLIVPYFRNTPLAFIFCGVNWDAQEYGFPCSNVTGMIEVQLIDQILKVLKEYARGDRISFIKGDDDSARKEADFFEKRFKIELDRRFVKDFAEWKDQYLLLQDESDMILVGNYASIKGWNDDEAKRFIHDHTKIPTGNWDAWMAPFCLVTFANNPHEQGEWAARTALRILNGEKPGNIPIAFNQKAKIVLNMPLAKKMDILFPMELIEQSTFVEGNVFR